MFEEEKPSVIVERSKIGDSFRYVTFRFRTKADLIEFAEKINRSELKTLGSNKRTMSFVWDGFERNDLEGFF